MGRRKTASKRVVERMNEWMSDCGTSRVWERGRLLAHQEAPPAFRPLDVEEAWIVCSVGGVFRSPESLDEAGIRCWVWSSERLSR